MDRDRFQQLVDEAWEAIPETFRERFSNLAVFVQDEPGFEHLQAAGASPGSTLWGFSRGRRSIDAAGPTA